MNYTENIEKKSDDEKKIFIEDATKYNDSLRDVLIENSDVDSVVNYLEQINKDDAIGYISIPKIDTYLTIYEGTSEKILETGIGHLEGTSMPVGGVGTHSALTGHTGLLKQKLFDDIDKLEIGDKFYIYVMDTKLSYEVDQIKIVEPDDDSELRIDDENDYVTLITCTPYGINSHRLLVRGRRIENETEESDEVILTNNDSAIKNNENNINENNQDDINFFKSREEKYRIYILLIKIFVIITLITSILGFYSTIHIRKKIKKIKN